MDFLSEKSLSQKNGMAGIVGTSDWLKFMCLGFLSFIPFIGWLIYLVVLIYLALNDKTSESVKSFIKASFIFLGISIAISLVLCFLLLGRVMSVFSLIL